MNTDKKRRLKIMPDYECYPIWIESKGAPENIDPSSLPIDAQLSNLLNRWAGTYNDTLNLDDPASSGFASPQDEKKFDLDGLDIWSQLQKALPEYEVTYFSIVENREMRPT